MSHTDVSSVTLTATGTVHTGLTRIRGIYFVSSGVAGSITIKDGGASGTTKILMATPAAVGSDNMLMPSNGVLFRTDAHVTLSNVTSATFVHG